MLKSPQVSVIIPVYNSEKYLKKCLNSVVNQTLQNIEIILVDDGSTDASKFIGESYARDDKRIIIIGQENKKQGAARNRGIEIANGRYIGFVDSDDFIDTSYFEKLLNAAVKYDADIAMASVVKIAKHRRKCKWKIVKEAVYHTDFDKFIRCNQNKNTAPYNKIYKTELIVEHSLRFPEGVFYEDGPFSVMAVHYSRTFVTVPNVNYYYTQNATSTVNSKQTTRHKTDAVNAKKRILQFVRTKKLALPNNTFHYTKKRVRILGITMYSMKENVTSETFYLFNIIPIWTRSI
ncbi:MAG: glycosyltransferase [Holosporales bacterium]|jgi:glycosyltransferase involved in cell wall biosynthesis|nr:glycosyltransferase [Holosporales bacterium]